MATLAYIARGCLSQESEKNFGKQYQPPLIVVSSDQPSFGFPLLPEYFPNILQWEKSWARPGASIKASQSCEPERILTVLKPSWTQAWAHRTPELPAATCSPPPLLLLLLIIRDSQIFFSNNKNIQITFLWEMFFTPHTSVINDFNHKINSAHLCNYLWIFFPTCFSA